VRISARLAAAAALAMAVAFLGLCRIIVHQGGADNAQPADAILVLGAAVFESGQLSPVLEARVTHAVQLYQRGLAPCIVVSGGVGAHPPSEAEAMARAAITAGVPAEALLLEPQAHTTQQSIRLAAPLLEERGFHSIIVVSSPFHLFRATWMARDAGFVAYGSGPQDDPLWIDRASRWRYVLREAWCFVLYLLLGL
jgi:uncharacterized SAM-binding protein YcdF (DUF218 family)